MASVGAKRKLQDGPTTAFGPVSQRAASLIDDVFAEGRHAVRPEASQLTIIMADFCPFANRAWIALLEKQGAIWSEIHSCYWMGEKDPGTAILYELGLKTLPAAVTEDGHILSESAMVADFIDDRFPGLALKPADPVMRFNMNIFRKQHEPLVDCFYGYLRAQEEEKVLEKRAKLLECLATFEANLAKFEGPFLCGEHFTLADIDLVGFIERCMVVLPHHKDFVFPSEHSHIHAWWQAVSARPSVKTVTAPRSALSVATQAFEAIEREAYLKEMYETYAADDLPLCRKIQAESGAPQHNAYRKYKLGLREGESGA